MDFSVVLAALVTGTVLVEQIRSAPKGERVLLPLFASTKLLKRRVSFGFYVVLQDHPKARLQPGASPSELSDGLPAISTER